MFTSTKYTTVSLCWLVSSMGKLVQSEVMEITVRPGKYVVAVSGGVDSMVLLDILRQQPGVDLVVAHFEHGIRQDSDEDRQLVGQVAAQYSLPFIYARGNLGAGASEAQARTARYAFLEKVQQEQGATAIVTAHHQDDLLETAILNIIRGTGRKGLSSLGSSGHLLRPLLWYSKQDILEYAQAHHIQWHEDSTNVDDRYLRNYIRHTILPRLGSKGREQLLGHIQTATALNPAIDSVLESDLARASLGGQLDRGWFIMLPYAVSCEAMAVWLRQHNLREFDRRAIDRLVVAAKTALAGKQFDVNAVYKLKVGKTTLELVPRSSSSKQIKRV